ncbi:MAG: hypothetical protein ACAH11_06485 [Sphingomonas sp.]
MTIERDKAPSAQSGEALGAIPAWPVQWPMIAVIGWWGVIMDAWQPKHCVHHADERHDLAVPDPIEREGEHALFA